MEKLVVGFYYVISLRAKRIGMMIFRKFSVLQCISVYFGQFVIMWSIYRFTLHVLHIRADFLVMKNEWVRRVLALVIIITSFLRFKLQKKSIFWKKGLMFISLFDGGTIVRFFCHVSKIFLLQRI